MKPRIQRAISRVALRLAFAYPKTDLGNLRRPLDDLLYIILSGQTDVSHDCEVRTPARSRWRRI